MTAPAAMPIHVGADSQKKPHDIVTLSFSEVFFQVEGQAICVSIYFFSLEQES